MSLHEKHQPRYDNNVAQRRLKNQFSNNMYTDDTIRWVVNVE